MRVWKDNSDPRGSDVCAVVWKRTMKLVREYPIDEVRRCVEFFCMRRLPHVRWRWVAGIRSQ
jgi:hypothetical protein